MAHPTKAGFIDTRCVFTKPRDAVQLTAGGRTLLETPNAGGNSIWSEVMSFEVIRACFGAELLHTELDIQYRPTSKITDYSVCIDGEPVGVSVTRVINFRDLKHKGHVRRSFTYDGVRDLLYKKLFGVIASTKGVLKRYRWKKQILHIWTTSAFVTRAVRHVYAEIDALYQHNTLVLVTEAKRGHWMF
mmetsp:Transcript_3364/g.3697  ORF Transcript_3364/g.3697 Transcript_3364/m.3697 type:complete len:188 (-) Transcript_3364:39-602(-)|eukprot:CAMPEP_0168525264 /NCGR_PEP_ID=MMETSP0405-20121227/11190_1 /TAXON_ID=498012 /ORGANISM="Trichosphaerium sp, Strain Am-I-7 wt" /LENGTH=187 /DNA_ID=CAMNT_0008547725 /DNA_START=665 /DNA_END=1228 /DNA_ORIENTATION=-